MPAPKGPNIEPAPAPPKAPLNAPDKEKPI
jgi:hypothetical protein